MYLNTIFQKKKGLATNDMFEGVNDIKKVKIAIEYNEKSIFEKNYRKASLAEKPICLRN